MDPNALISTCRHALDDNGERHQALCDLRDWLKRGGFLPRPVPEDPRFLSLHTQRRARIVLHIETLIAAYEGPTS